MSIHPVPKRWILYSLLGFLATLPVLAQKGGGSSPPPPVLAGVDIFGNSRTPDSEILALLDIEEGGSLTPQIVTQLDEKIRSSGKFAYAKVSSIVYGNRKGFLTVDVIEKGEEQRLRYTPAPTGNVEIPDVLIQLGKDYQTASYRTFMENPKSFRDIDAGHYLDTDPEVRGYEMRILELVPLHYDLLVRTLSEDGNPQKRALAALLLGWAPDKKQVLEPLGRALSDSDTRVRTSAARSLIPIAYLAVQEGFPFPLDPVFRLLHYPTAADRNKAASILVHLATAPSYHKTIEEQAGAILIRMAAAKQPTQRERALTVLTLVTGMDYGQDIQKWEAWWASRS